MSPQIRSARPDDAAAIAEIYNREVTETTVTFDLEPRDLATQRAWIDARSGAHAVLVAVETDEDGDEVVLGFASLSAYRDRPGYRTTVEDSIYIHRDHRGRGLGRVLLSGLIREAEERGFHAVMARIVGGHSGSVALHESLGFEVVGVEREVGRKFGRWLDVTLMQLLFRPPGERRDPLIG